jgi:glutaconyl-CoA/methylmalonyl-CoA decarboxylase subunit gamma
MMKSYNLRIGAQTFTAQIVEYTETKVVVDLNGNTYEVELSSESSTDTVPAPRGSTAIKPPAAAKPAAAPKAEEAPRAAARETTATAGAISAPIPGAVKKILVSVGDDVEEGTVVLVLEAMKMENEITARLPGKVTEIAVGLDESVQEGQLLIRVEAS